MRRGPLIHPSPADPALACPMMAARATRVTEPLACRAEDPVRKCHRHPILPRRQRTAAARPKTRGFLAVRDRRRGPFIHAHRAQLQRSTDADH